MKDTLKPTNIFQECLTFDSLTLIFTQYVGPNDLALESLRLLLRVQPWRKSEREMFNGNDVIQGWTCWT